MFSFLVLSSEFRSLLLENGMASNDSGAIAITNGDDGLILNKYNDVSYKYNNGIINK